MSTSAPVFDMSAFLTSNPFLSSGTTTGTSQADNPLGGLSTPVTWDTSAATGMEGIPSPITSIRPSLQTSPSTSPSVAPLGTILNSAASNIATGSANTVAGSIISAVWGGTERYVVIILGLIIIAAGLFSFDRAREVGTHFAKGIAEGAAVA